MTDEHDGEERRAIRETRRLRLLQLLDEAGDPELQRPKLQRAPDRVIEVR